MPAAIEDIPGQEGATLVEGLIAQFERDLANGRFPPGSFMGTRQDLCAAYGVTSETFFQASRVLIHRGLAEMRTGNRGGLFACDHSLDQVAKRMATYLECIGVDFPEAAPVSRLLQEWCVRAATGNVSVRTATAIRAIAGELATCDTFDRGRLLRSMFQQFASASGNVVLALLYRLSTDLMLAVSSDFAVLTYSDVPTETYVGLAVRLAEAVISADHDEAAFAYQQFRDALLRRQGSQRAPHARELPMTSFADRDIAARDLPERLAVHILREIRVAGWPVGQKLGNEPDLMQRYGVSRATFRQALRLLEEYSAIETRRGPKGGVIINQPNPELISGTALSLLIGRGATLEMSRPLLVSVLALGLDFALSMQEQSATVIADACRKARLRKGPEGVGLLTSAILTQGRVRELDLIVRLLGDLETGLQPEAGAVDEDYAPILDELAKAVASGDRVGGRCAIAELTQRYGVGRLPMAFAAANDRPNAA